MNATTAAAIAADALENDLRVDVSVHRGRVHHDHYFGALVAIDLRRQSIALEGDDLERREISLEDIAEIRILATEQNRAALTYGTFVTVNAGDIAVVCDACDGAHDSILRGDYVITSSWRSRGTDGPRGFTVEDLSGVHRYYVTEREIVAVRRDDLEAA